MLTPWWLLLFETTVRTDKILKQQVIEAIPPTFIRGLKNRITGFAGVSCLQLISFLKQQYGRVSEQQLEDNDKIFRKSYDIGTPIEELYGQIEDCVDLAEAGGAPYTHQQVLANALNLLRQTGVLNEYIRDWKRKDPNDKTWHSGKSNSLPEKISYYELVFSNFNISKYIAIATIIIKIIYNMIFPSFFAL